jgi:hypothetical protein
VALDGIIAVGTDACSRAVAVLVAGRPASELEEQTAPWLRRAPCINAR